MIKKVNYGKIVVVIFLTVLIWVWADLAQDTRYTVSNATITIAKSVPPNLWVSFGEETTIASIGEITLKGSVPRINDLKRKLNDGSFEPRFFLQPEQSGMTATGPYTLRVLDFLKKDEQIKALRLSVEDAETHELPVNVVELVEKTLTIRCKDAEGNIRKNAVIEPAQIKLPVPPEWDGDALIAYVMLIQREIDQAKVAPMSKTPYLKLGDRQVRYADTMVKVTMPPEEEHLEEHTIKGVTLGYILSENLKGKYEPVVENRKEVISPVTISATPEAKREYDKMTYHVILEIYDSDVDAGPEKIITRPVVYNFPPKYVQTDEIVLKSQLVEARFRLVSLPAADDQ